MTATCSDCGAVRVAFAVSAAGRYCYQCIGVPAAQVARPVARPVATASTYAATARDASTADDKIGDRFK